MKGLLKAGVALSFGMALSGVAHADIAIATAGPMTGQYAAFGKQMKDGIFIHQEKYVHEVLKRFSMENSKEIKTPMASNGKN